MVSSRLHMLLEMYKKLYMTSTPYLLHIPLIVPSSVSLVENKGTDIFKGYL
jgi:hypothetical protein